MLRLVTPPQRTQLTTLAAAQTDLGVADVRISALIDQASEACVAFCGRPFAQASWEETFFGADGPLVLSRIPVTEIASVASGEYQLPETDWTFDQGSGLLHRHTYGQNGSYGIGYGQGWGYFQTVVSYTAGYVLPGGTNPTLPATIERACLEMVRALWFSTGPGGRDPTIRSESVQGIGTTSYFDPQPGTFGLPALATSLLQSYRNLRS